MKNKLFPCVWYDGNARQAADLYCAAFPRTVVLSDNGMVVMTQTGDSLLMGLNGGPVFTPNASISFFMSFSNEKEMDVAWSRLSEKGKVFMPMDKYPWSNKYGWIQDQYGVSWQLMLQPVLPQTLTPALMFTHTVAGKAEAAMQFYTSLFPDSSIESISRYEKGEGDVEGSVKHGRFTLNNQLFVAFDSHIQNSFSFNEGVSISVACDTQEEIDKYWSSLTAGGGQESMCGWLKDKYGVSWQIVPSMLGSILSNPVNGQRAMQALMKMRKLEIDKLMNA